MAYSDTLIETFRPKLAELADCRLVRLAEDDAIRLEHLRVLATQEYFLVPEEPRHVAAALARTGSGWAPGDLQLQRTLGHMISVFLGEWEDYYSHVRSLGLDLGDLRSAAVSPGAHYFIAYSHYSGAALAPQQHIAFLYVVWVSWAEVCTRLDRALRSHGRFADEQLEYMSQFTARDHELLEKMRRVIDAYGAEAGENRGRLEWSVQMGLGAEELFWDSIAGIIGPTAG